MKEDNIEEKLEKIAKCCEKLNDMLTNIYFSIKDKKKRKEYLYILKAAGRLEESCATLRPINDEEYNKLK